MVTHASPELGLAKAPRVLLILDMISDFNFPDGPAVLRAARRIVPDIERLKARAAAARVPVIYVNDNIGPWRSDIRGLLAHCQAAGAPGADVVRRLAPGDDDLVILKPRHSGFYATPLAAILEQAGTRQLVLTGVSAHQCVLFTANDAHLRHLELIVPRDCVGAASAADNRLALKYFSSVLGANTRESSRLQLRPHSKRGSRA
ncbi:MAG: vibB [Gammaproteobacteria bacterium]|jgi:nicotinamidase-related amidase|nr:vibB [Gammaproteobacteria bacterium]